MKSEFILYNPKIPHNDNVNGIFAGLLTSGQLYAKAALDRIADLLSTTNSLKTFYVDSNNPNNGDGSITNPFKTLDLALNKIIGSGNRNSPQYANMGVKVFSGSYSTSENLAVRGITWYFDEGAVINATSCPGALFDLSVITASPAIVRVLGNGDFTVNACSLIKVPPMVSTSNYRTLYFEALNVLSTATSTTEPELYPIIKAGEGGAPGDNGFKFVLYLIIKYQITSYGQTICIVNDKAKISVLGGLYFMSNGNTVLSANARMFKIVRTQNVELFNLQVRATSIDYLFEIGHGTAGLGNIRFLNINNVIIGSGSSSAPRPKRVLLIKANTALDNDGAGGLNAPSIKVSVRQGYGYFSENTDLVNFEGAGTFNGIELINCYLDGRISSKIDLSSFPNHPNVFGERMNLGSVPEYADDTAAGAAGLVAGEVYKTASGQLMIKA